MSPFGNRGKRKFSDQEIISGIRKGEHVMFDQLYIQCRLNIHGYVITNSGTIDDAEDIVQETVLAVYEQIKDKLLTLNRGTKLSTYLMGVAKNKWLNRLRQKGRMVVIPKEDQIYEIDNREEYQLKEEQFKMINDFIERLDETCRKILRDRYWLKKKFHEIRIDKFKTVDALKMKSSRCHDKLRSFYG